MNSLREIDLEYIKSDDNQFGNLLKLSRSVNGVFSNLIRLSTPFGLTKTTLVTLEECIKSMPKLSRLRINGMWTTSETIAKSLRLTFSQLVSLELGSALTPAPIDGLQFLVLAKSMPLLEHLHYEAPVRLDSSRTLVGNPTTTDFKAFISSNYPNLTKLTNDGDHIAWFTFWGLPPMLRESDSTTNVTIRGYSLIEDVKGLDWARIRQLRVLATDPNAFNVLRHTELSNLESLAITSVVWPLQISLLQEFTNLRDLRLSTLIPVSEDAPVLDSLRGATSLHTLVLLMRTQWQDIQQIGFPNSLTSLSLYGDQSLTSLRPLADAVPLLISLELLFNRELSGRDECHYISYLTKLTHLSFRSGRLDPLQSSTELENPTLSHKTAIAFASLPLLRSLDLSGLTVYKPKIAAEIAKCSSLRRLLFNYATIGQEALQALSPLRYYLSEVGVGFCSEINAIQRGKEAALAFLQLLSRTLCSRVETLDIRSSVLRLSDVAASLRYNDFPLLRTLVVTDHHEFSLPSKAFVSQFAQGIIDTSYTLRYEIQKITAYRLSSTGAVLDHQNFGQIIQVFVDGKSSPFV
jgi:hypothetical protein